MLHAIMAVEVAAPLVVMAAEAALTAEEVIAVEAATRAVVEGVTAAVVEVARTAVEEAATRIGNPPS